MKRALLDINVLLALFDSDHVDHERARDWLNDEVEYGWASCAITQNGFARILSQPGYPSPVAPGEAIRLLAEAAATKYHQFWTCAVSLVDDGLIDRTKIQGHRQLTDIYLLALAAENDGRFVTLDKSVPVAAARAATSDHLVVL